MASASAASPIFITGAERQPLTPVRLGKGRFSEAWLQALIHDQPECLPIAEIEPGFGTAIAAAREVACGHGFIDNVYLTPVGEIIIVETKLWANPQARREVVAQALDYAAALSAMRYEHFEAAVLKANGTNGEAGSLHQIVANHPDALEESAFIDAIALNLARGRMLVIAAGDGIRRETETLAALLQSHAGAHFTFALVELAVYETGTEDAILVIPSTLMKTMLIERGVVRIADDRIRVDPVVSAKMAAARTAAGPRAQSLSEVEFYEQLAVQDATLPAQLQAFITSLEPLGVYGEYRTSLNLKLDHPAVDQPINLGFVDKDGRLYTRAVGWILPRSLADRYVRRLAALIGGEVVDGKESPIIKLNGKAPPLKALLPAHAEGWTEAIRLLIASLTQDHKG